MYLNFYRFNFEWGILDFFHKINNSIFDYIFYFISELGSSTILIILITLIYYCINKQLGRKIAFITFFGITFNNIIKASFNAKRPFEYLGKEELRALNGTNLSDKATGTSFPSGHSQNSSTFFFSVYLNFKHKIIRIACVLLMMLVPISRLYLGVHFPIDVVIGVILGILTAVIMNYLLNRFPNHHLLIMIISFLVTIPFIFLPNIAKDFFKGSGLLLGIIIGSHFEEKYVNFETSGTIKEKIIRYLFSIIIVGITYAIIHIVNHLDFIESSKYLLYLSNFITHTLLIIVGIFVVPLLFTKILNKKKKLS